MKELNFPIEKLALLLPVIFVGMYVALTLFFSMVAPETSTNNLEATLQP